MEPSKCRVLLVDDHVQTRITLRSLLSQYADVHIVGEACDGRHAIEQVPACKPNVIVMDIYMPRMNGIEATRVIKTSWREVAIVGICAVYDMCITDVFLKAGALAVISKDRVDDLYSTIQRACPTTARPV